MSQLQSLRRIVLPGLVFQSIIVGGGYATGREIVEFFFPSGAYGGVLGLLVAGVVFSVMLALAFEFARVTNAYDYRSFCRNLLGQGWPIFEIAYLCLLVLVLSVIGSASGELIADIFGLPPFVGIVGLTCLVATLAFLGSDVIQRFMASWSILLYGAYIFLFVAALIALGDNIDDAFAAQDLNDGWAWSGIQYAGYNLAIIPAALFTTRNLTSARETVLAGVLAGALAIIPAILFFIAMLGRHPEIAEAPVPVLFLMQALDIGWFAIIFQLIVFGTFVETGTGLIHAVNERLNASFSRQGVTMTSLHRGMVALALSVISITAATTFGIVTLIAKGYAALTIVFIGVLIIPLMTVGALRIFKRA